jgi:hypothetical protein
MRRSSYSSLWFALLLGVSNAGQCNPTRPSLCQAPELTHFSCQTPAKKTVSICSAGGNSLQYRFDKPHAVELQFPKAIAGGAQQFKYAHYFRAQTDYWELRFTNNDVGYSVFERSVDGKKSAGVEINLANGGEKQITCVGKFVSNLEALKSVVPCDADSALNAGSCPAK